jgi:hypothetical protein
MVLNKTGSGYSYNTRMVFQSRQATCKLFRKTDSVLVDGVRWYTVKCNDEVSTWIRSLPGEYTQWYEWPIRQDWLIKLNKFEITEKVYMQLCLKWT